MCVLTFTDEYKNSDSFNVFDLKSHLAYIETQLLSDDFVICDIENCGIYGCVSYYFHHFAKLFRFKLNWSVSEGFTVSTVEYNYLTAAHASHK